MTAISNSALEPAGEETGRLLPGATIGRYEILRLLGIGSMGAVYLARDPLIDRQVAVKTLSSDVAVDAAQLTLLRERLLNEARSAGALRHPGIVTVYDVMEEDDGRISIAMEYVEGTTLRSRLDHHEPLPLDFALRTISSLAEALDYAHARGVVHRDVKPANILLTADGSVKVADFGIASLRGTDLAGELNALGTPNYLAPERILGSEADERSDVYALGVILYEVLTRRLPFQGQTMGELARKVLQETHTDPRELRPDLSARMVEILATALAKEPESRYQAAGELARDLSRAVREQAVLSDTVPAVGVEVLDPVDPEGDGDEEITKKIVPQPERAPPRSIVLRLGTLPGSLLGRLLTPGRAALLGIMGLVAAVAILAVSTSAMNTRNANRTLEAEAQRRADYDALITESERLILAGEHRRAEELIRRAEALSPEAAGIAELRAEARRTRQAEAEAQRQAEIQALFGEAQAAFEKRDLGATELALAVLLEIDPDHEGGRTLVEAVAALRDALERRAPAAALVEEPEIDGDPEPLQAAAPVFEPFESPPVVSIAAPYGTVRIDFRSERPRGVVTLYLGDEQILHRPFRFVEKKSLLRRKGVAGSFDESKRVPAGTLDLRLYLTLPNRPAQSRRLTGNLTAGSLRTLRVRVGDGGVLGVEFF
ncbi:MAG: protein kinase [Acidobacteriota bacterium]|nr:protein kinase [Acidobacteriota bacterium]